MKNFYLLITTVMVMNVSLAQTPFQRVYSTLNTKCQNATCHSSTASDGSQALPFDGSENTVYYLLINKNSSNASSVAKFEKIVKPGHPYMSFLLRKIAGASFDTDLALDAGEGALMTDINGDTLNKKDIEFIRQWIMYSAKKSYSNNEPKPDYQLVSDYYDNPVNPFLPKPVKPAAGTGLQFRMGPVFLPTTGATEQEWLLQQEVNFPVLPEVDRIDGFMNQQSHHFLLFQFIDSSSAAYRSFGMEEVAIAGGATSFDGDKYLTSAWQDDAEFTLPTGTALFWDKKTYLDMNYHIKNYNATGVLPTDFYFNIYYKERDPNTIEMKAELQNNVTLFLPQGVQNRTYEDQSNNDNAKTTRYLWALTSHAHKYGTDYDLYERDTTGALNQIYEGFWDYKNNVNLGFYDWEHPSTRYWDNFYPVKFGKHGNVNAGLVAKTTWNIQEPFVTFGFTTNDEMQLFYYFYTDQNPNAVSSINAPEDKGIYFDVVPNPNNGNAQISYELADFSEVNISVYDITGNSVLRFDNQTQDEGIHKISIDGNSLAAGVYFINLSINGNVYTKKMIVN